MRESLTMIEVALVGVTHCHIEGFVKRIGARDDVNVRSVWDRDVGRAAAVAKARIRRSPQLSSQVEVLWR